MFSRFFIYRPIFATVISIVIVITGLVTLGALPVEQYPDISPPTVQVSAFYPGANASVLAETVAAPIEQEVNGVEGMLYMSSTCANDGSYALTVTFEVGTDMDMASVLVQNRVATAEPKLPEEVKRTGVTTKKKSTSIVLMIALTSPDDTYDDLYLSNFATLRLRDEMARIKGVGDVFTFGVGDYSMRIWLDPNKLKARRITTNDVIQAIREQNVQVAAGQIGQPPVPAGQDFQYVINTLGRLEDIEQFENIIVKTTDGNRITRVRDVATVELGAKTYGMAGLLNGKPTALLGIYQLPGANAIELAENIRAKMAELKQAFPQGLEYEIPFDTTQFVQASIDEVMETLFIAVFLVFITIFVFLQDWRASLVPGVAIPVSLIGTFAAMGALGFSLNMLTLFGIVLAIGIVVDDAIVVVENTARNIDEFHMEAKEATVKAMEEVAGPVIATTLVLLAVFVPTAFLGGIVGQMYRQFALTISAATVFSSINALTMSPALCGMLLRPARENKNAFFRGFEWGFDKSKNGYERIVGKAIRMTLIMMVVFGGLAGASWFGFTSLPAGFLPQEDQGYAMASIQLPDAAAFERTVNVVREVEKKVREIEGVQDVISVPGYSVMDSAQASNAGVLWIVYAPFEKRKTPELSQQAIVKQVWGVLARVQEANAFAIIPPAIPGLGVGGGFQMMLQDRGAIGLAALEQMAEEMGQDANGQAALTGVYTTFRANVPQLFAEVDRVKAKSLNVLLSEIFSTLQAYLGSSYVNDFNKFGRTYQVNIQADARYRLEADAIKDLEVRNSRGEMVPLGTLVGVDEVLGPQIINRYNLYPSAAINGNAAPGYSSGQALELMEQMAGAKLPTTMGFEWTGMSFQEKAAGNPAIIFALAIIFVYLVLCAQYESWSVPLCIILSVPLGLLGTVAAVAMRSMDVNIYTQIGVVLLIALASKNAILIVEFAREKRQSGMGIIEAAGEAARLRFRPILMTSFSFVLGTFPLVVAQGAGAASRQTLGTAVFGGMVAATFLTVLFVPVFYVVIQRFSEWLRPEKSGAEAARQEEAESV
ncbi:transporter [Desulfonema ishimotonii]|uniref:Transporter n=1 Tax=Desulfonema ishimotonii TaxID=45657 RepID=A0A401FQF8_9BACT|nr:multidrug efflux RND transporter permease subunit [Desulfonema ishimotonii]GBC59224.1 transporter [Desulfonema ishimotonii]